MRIEITETFWTNFDNDKITICFEPGAYDFFKGCFYHLIDKYEGDCMAVCTKIKKDIFGNVIATFDKYKNF